MATKTFSSRADEAGLAYADAVTRKEFGMSFGQYCGSMLVEAVLQGIELPRPNRHMADDTKTRAAARIKAIASGPHDARIGRLSDDEVKGLIASRYE